MTKQLLTVEWVRRVQALQIQGFDVTVTTDADGVIIHIRKKSLKHQRTRSRS